MLLDPKIEGLLEISDTGKAKPIKAFEAIHKINYSDRLEGKIGEFIKFAYDIT